MAPSNQATDNNARGGLIFPFFLSHFLVLFCCIVNLIIYNAEKFLRKFLVANHVDLGDSFIRIYLQYLQRPEQSFGGESNAAVSDCIWFCASGCGGA